MAETYVTRELVQELAETGTAQLSSLKDRMPVVQTGLLDEADGALIKSQPIIIEATRQILALSGYDSDGLEPTFKVQTSKISKPLEENPKIIDQIHTDYDAGLNGFTILWSFFGPCNEELWVAGRGPEADLDHIKKIRYSGGPIVIAQRNFGIKLLKGSQDPLLGPTWHNGARIRPGLLGIADLEYDEEKLIWLEEYRLRRDHTSRV